MEMRFGKLLKIMKVVRDDTVITVARMVAMVSNIFFVLLLCICSTSRALSINLLKALVQFDRFASKS